MNADAAREVVRAIPVPALVPARMLVDEAVGIVGRHAVVRRARRPVLLFLSEATRPSPAVRARSVSALTPAALRRSNFPAGSASTAACRRAGSTPRVRDRAPPGDPPRRSSFLSRAVSRSLQQFSRTRTLLI